MFNLKNYLTRLETPGIGYEKSPTGQYKGDYYVAAGNITPHLHLSANGNFVGLKGKRGAITTLVNDGVFKIDTIRLEIDDLKVSHLGNDITVTNAMLELARQHKQTG